MLVRVYVLYSSSFIRVEMICRITTNGIFIFAKPIKTPTRLTTPSAPNRYYFRFYIRYFLCFYSLSVLLCLYYDFHNNNGKLIGIGLVIVCMPVNHMQMASEEKRKKKIGKKENEIKTKHFLLLIYVAFSCFQWMFVFITHMFRVDGAVQCCFMHVSLCILLHFVGLCLVFECVMYFFSSFLFDFNFLLFAKFSYIVMARFWYSYLSLLFSFVVVATIIGFSLSTYSVQCTYL